MNFSTIILVLMVILNTGLAALIILSNAKSSINKFFALFIFSVVLWMGSLYLSNFIGDFSLFWTKLTFLGAILIGCFLVYFATYFPWNKRAIFWWEHLLIIAPTAIISFLILFTNKIIADITVIETGTGVTQGVWYYIWPVYFLSFIITALYLLIKKYRLSEEKQKIQIRFVFIGLSLSLLMAIITNLVAPLVFKNDALSNIGPYSSIIFIGLTAYIIVKHGLMDIKVILVETATVLVSLAVLAQTLLSQGFWEGFINAIILILVVYGGYLIIKSVQNEIRQKEELQILSKQLEQANAHLKELDAMKTEFVSLASHELLTPVSAIEGYLSMLLDEKMARVDDPKAKKYLDNVYLSAKRLARLIADMLNISRIEEGRLSVEKKEVNIGDTIDQVIAEIRFKAEERKQKVVFHRDPQANYSTFADPDKIKEIVINIIGNSIKYSRDPGTIIVTVQKVPRQMVDSTWARIEADIKARPLDDQEAIKSAVDPHYRELVGEEQLMISVKDQGVGIPREELPRLFKKFHRVGNYSTQESQGTGLGLYISRALVELQHGRIWADSEGEGKGSTFTFTLPELAVKDQILQIEQQIPMDKEQMKPLARPMKSAAEEL